MLRIREKEIRQWFPQTDYLRGKAIYDEGGILEYEERQIHDGAQAQCLVQGNDRYEVTVRQIGRSVSGECPCVRYDTMGYCKHLIAALLCFADAGAEESAVGKRGGRLPVTTDDALARLMNARITGEEEPQKEKTLHLEAKFNFRDVGYSTGDYPEIGLQIGVKRLYAVKNVVRLFEDFRERKSVEYGKGVVFVHDEDMLDERSHALYALLRDIVMTDELYHYVSGFNRCRAGINGTNRVILRGIDFDRLFDFYLGETVEVQGKEKCLFEEGIPKAGIELKAQTDTATATVACEGVQSFFGTEIARYCLVTENRGMRLLRLPKEYNRDVFPVIQVLNRSRRIALPDMTLFTSCIYPKVKDVMEVKDKDGLLCQYTPDTCVPCFYLDFEKDVLMLSYKFKYGEKLLAEDEKDDSVRRDVLAERRVRNIIARTFDFGERGYTLEGEQAFTFLVTGLEMLRGLGEVYLTNRLRNLRVKDKAPKVGVSVEDGLLRIDFDAGEFPAEELEALYSSIIQKKKYYRLKDGRYIPTQDDSAYETLAKMAHMTQLSKDMLKKGHAQVPLYRALYLDGLLKNDGRIAFDRDAEFREMLRNFKSVEDNAFCLEKGLREVLRPYQLVGFQWLKTLESAHFGGILADEMGLGKTLQMIAFFSTVPRNAVGSPSLVVCPASLVLNWLDECARFAPMLKTVTIIGNAAQRKELLEKYKDSADLLITSFDLLKRDIEEYEQIAFYCCTLDEAQFVKNRETAASKAVKRIRCTQRFVLTGTPIENRLSELWNLFDYLMPGYLFTYTQFVEKLEKPILKSEDQEAAEQLKRLVQPFMLRRLKKDVLKELPPKVEHTYRIHMGETERKTYVAYAAAALRRMGEDTEKLQILAAMMRLRQICCDPHLCIENYNGETTKLDACVDLCRAMTENRHQILLFSQFTSMLETLRTRLENEGMRTFTLQGATSKEKRAALVKAFNAGDADVFLISLKAGGTGLNLTAADVVIHYDPWWNMAARNQATDRAHRFGQQQSVQVYSLIAENTIEEKIQKLQERKAELLDAVTQAGESDILSMSKEDLLDLFTTEEIS